MRAALRSAPRTRPAAASIASSRSSSARGASVVREPRRRVQVGALRRRTDGIRLVERRERRDLDPGRLGQRREGAPRAAPRDRRGSSRATTNASVTRRLDARNRRSGSSVPVAGADRALEREGLARHERRRAHRARLTSRSSGQWRGRQGSKCDDRLGRKPPSRERALCRSARRWRAARSASK